VSQVALCADENAAETYLTVANFVYDNYAPKLTAALAHLSGTVYQETQLSIRVVEAARIRTAQINGCRTCSTWRAARDLPDQFELLGGDVGRSFVGRADVKPDEAFYEAIEHWQSATIFDERERLAIEVAERMGEAPRSFEGDVSFWTRMHTHFTDDEIVDLLVSIGSWIAAGRFMHILEIDLEVCSVGPAQPVPRGKSQ
jgi:alkylhydroperoxidase family enzyme